jgi:hypothetical protein
LRIGHFDCFAGASGDMILACLFDLGLKEEAFLEGLSSLKIGKVAVEVSDVMRGQVRAKAFRVMQDSDPQPRRYREIVGAIHASSLSGWIKQRSFHTFEVLAEAESHIHGIPVDEVHFHEVGAVDSIVDVVGSFLGLELLGIQQVTSSPLTLGSGSVQCEHGTLPVPAPATLQIARGLPVRSWPIESELTTPTGAAILRIAASQFGPIPAMKATAVGYGAGFRDLTEIPNIMRFLVGETSDYGFDRVALVETNIDDMNPQFFSHLYDDLFESGALDVWVSSVVMKKGRPGFVLSVLVEPPSASKVIDLVLSGTTTSGVRLTSADRVKLHREIVEVRTKYGTVKAKVFKLDSGLRCVPEYEDCLRISRTKGVSIQEVMDETRNAFGESP